MIAFDFVKKNKQTYKLENIISNRNDALLQIIQKQWWNLAQNFLEFGKITDDLFDFTFLEYKVNESSTVESTNQNKVYKSIENKYTLEIASNCDRMHPLMLIAMSGNYFKI
jgi:hypothetical protein